MTRIASPSPSSLVVSLTLAAAAVLPGCGLFYRYHYRSADYSIHSNQGPGFLVDTAGTVGRIFAAYRKLFGVGGDELGTATLLIDGEPDVVDASYSPELLGYYVPFFRLIHVDTRSPWTRDRRMFTKVLLHEIAHHFLISRFPRINDACWLNEGLAGNLETARLDGKDIGYPLLNPPLLRTAREAVWTGHPSASLAVLTGMPWSGFHDARSKQVNYALAWSIVYYVLEVHLGRDLPLGERIARLVALDRAELIALEEGWAEHLLTFDLEGEIARLAAGGGEGNAEAVRLVRIWALDELGRSVGCGERSLAVIEKALEDGDMSVRDHAAAAVLRAVACRTSGRWKRADAALRRLARDPGEPLELRRAVLREAGRRRRRSRPWLRLFIDLLEDPVPGIRALAAEGLARARVKPTIVNPSFWERADAARRRREVLEWQAWWHAGEETRRVTTEGS